MESDPTVVIDSTDGRRLELGAGRWAYDAGGPWEFSVLLAGPGFEATTRVYDRGFGLAEFFDGIAAGYAGWEGDRVYASLEGQLRLTAHHDGKGLVTLRTEVGSLTPPEWAARADLTIGAGAHADRIARAVRRMVTASDHL